MPTTKWKCMCPDSEVCPAGYHLQNTCPKSGDKGEIVKAGDPTPKPKKAKPAKKADAKKAAAKKAAAKKAPGQQGKGSAAAAAAAAGAAGGVVAAAGIAYLLTSAFTSDEE